MYVPGSVRSTSSPLLLSYFSTSFSQIYILATLCSTVHPLTTPFPICYTKALT